MLRTLPLLLIATLGVFALPHSNATASIITENFYGANSVGFQDVSTSQSMSTGLSVFTKTVTEVVGSAVLSYEINVIAASGNVYSQSGRGLGDGGNENQFTNNDGVFNFKINNINASLSPSAMPGSSIVSSQLDVEFTSFDVVNNGQNRPLINWTDNGSSPSLSTPAMVIGGQSSGFITQVNSVTQDSQDLKFDNVGSSWAWINNVQTAHSGTIIVATPVAVPEPGSICLIGIASLSMLFRRRRSAN